MKNIIVLTILVSSFVFCSCGKTSSQTNCEICGKKFKNGDTRIRTTRVVDGKKVVVCNQCYVVGTNFGKCLSDGVILDD